MYDTTIGWRFINKLMKEKYGVDSMPETAENVAVDFKIEREAQDQMALRSQAQRRGRHQGWVSGARNRARAHPAKKGDGAIIVSQDEHPVKPAWR